MGRFLGSGWFVILMTTVSSIGAQQEARSIDVSSKCLGNVMRFSTGSLGGNLLEAAVGINGSLFPLTPSLASQCGFSMRMDPLGGAVIFASVHNCFAKNKEDKKFTTVVHFRLHGNRMTEDELYHVAESCIYTPWASREILCDHNYMEVSVRRTIPEDYVLPPQPIPGTSKLGDPRRAANQQEQMGASGFRMTSIVFHTPEEKIMTVAEAQRRGYGVANTPTRLVVRSPQNAPETYILDVAGVPMTVLKTSTIFEKKWLATQIDAAAVCPTPTGGLSFTPDMITWHFPRHIDPLVTSDHFRLLQVHMGVSGQRLDSAEMAARRYIMAVDENHIAVNIPVGAVGGYFKSHVEDGQYFITYNIEPMLELRWVEEDEREETRYKVLFSITTPPTSSPPQVTDNTVPEEKVFKLLLGPLGSDVALVNITFSTEVLTVADCNTRGFNVQVHKSNNGSKVFSLDVPFTDPVVLQTRGVGVTVFRLDLMFGLLVLPEFSSFAHSATLEAALVDIVPPSVSASCDRENFHVTVKYGTRGFQTVLGKRAMTPALAQQYGFIENGTHFSFMVPNAAPDAVFEAVQASSIKSRLDVALRDPQANTNIQELSVACNFPSALTECFSNGTMATLAVKLESVPSLNLSQLTLRDPACGPAYSDDRVAYFLFSGSTCGTTRKFFSNAMVYENEISLPDHAECKTNAKMDEPEYEFKVSCYYESNTTHSIAFLIRPRNNEPYAEPAAGELLITMRLFLDDSYSQFHGEEEYPIPKYLRQPLYFEVELIKSTNPKVELQLENCWATLLQDRTSRPRWNLIINGCANPVDPYQAVFHPVHADARVKYPSHFKRFVVQMFAFAAEQDDLHEQVFVHCDVIICDANSPKGGLCGRQCSNQDIKKGQRRAVSDVLEFKHVSSGEILLV